MQNAVPATATPREASVSKRRSARACTLCRTRKVRCDVVSHGIPCSNCRYHGSACVVAERQSRQRKSTQPFAPPGRDAGAYTNAVTGLLPTPERGTRRRSASLDSHSSASNIPVFDSSRTALPPPPGAFSELSGRSTIVQAARPESCASQAIAAPSASSSKIAGLGPYQSPTRSQSSLESRWGCEEILDGSVPPDRHQVPASRTSSFIPQTTAPSRQGRSDAWAAGSPLPGFIQPLPAHLQPEDVEHLKRKGALIIPEMSLRESLLVCFIQFVHPYLPIVELHELLPIIDAKSGLPPISLILLQAIMLSATPYVDTRCLTLHGYSSRQTLRRVFYQRVKLLCDFDYEMDRLTVLRSVLLMTCWNEDPDHPKGTLFWIDVAISHARTLKLDSCTVATGTKTSGDRLRRRLWWVCYCRDRLSALALRRQPRLADDSFQVPSLEEDDFETDSVPEPLQRFCVDCSVMQDPHAQQQLPKLLIALIALCKCIGQILVPSDSHSGTFAIAETMLAEKTLRAWSDKYPECFRTTERSPSATGTSRGWDPTHAFRAILSGLYQTLIITLYRPHVVRIRSAPELFDFSVRMVRDAAEKLTNIFASVEAINLTSVLPSTAVTCVVAAASIHLRDMKMGSMAQKRKSSQHLRASLRSLQELANMYSSAAFALDFLNIATAKAQEQFASSSGVEQPDKGSRPTPHAAGPYQNSTLMSLIENGSDTRGLSPTEDGTSATRGFPHQPWWSTHDPQAQMPTADYINFSNYPRRTLVDGDTVGSPWPSASRNVSDMNNSFFWGVENRDNLVNMANGLLADFDQDLFNMLSGDDFEFQGR